MVRPITHKPASVLHQPTTPVREPTAESIRTLIRDLKETCREAGGVGLAAPQIGSSLRVCVVYYPQDDPPYGLINPKIVWSSKGTSVLEEGCLSIPGETAHVSRPVKVRVQALDESGRTVEIAATDFLAKVLQHEIDHLNGILITDH